MRWEWRLFLLPAVAQRQPDRGDTMSHVPKPLHSRSVEILAGVVELDPEEPLTEADVSKWLKLSRQWLAAARCRGGGPPYVWLGRGLVRYRRKDVISWLDSHRKNSTAEYAAQLPPRSPGRPKKDTGGRATKRTQHGQTDSAIQVRTGGPK